jgi:8-oxo-dGTP diphosphatase
MRHAPGIPGLDGKWELPGGKINFGETPEQAVIREIREELGLKIKPLRLLPYLHTNFWEYEHVLQHVVLACYECEQEEGSEVLNSDDVRWFNVGAIDFESTLPGTRDFVSLAVNNEWFDKFYISFELIDPEINAKKHFSVGAQPTLFSKYGLVKYWGRIGSWSRVKSQEFQSPTEMDLGILEIVKLRLRHGYRIAAIEGNVQRYRVLGEIMDLARKKGALAERMSTN